MGSLGLSHCSWHTQRRQNKDLAGAVVEYTRSIELDPTNAIAFRNRGNARYLKEKFDLAIADYNKAIELDPKAADAYWSRAWIKLGLNDGSGTHQDAAEYLALLGPKTDDAPYAIILGYLGLRKAGSTAEAKTFLDDWLPQVDAQAWSTEILRFLAGQSPAEQLLALADDNDKLTEAHAFIGEMQLLASNRPDALVHFQWVRDKGNKEFPEYDLALAELKRIKPE